MSVYKLLFFNKKEHQITTLIETSIRNVILNHIITQLNMFVILSFKIILPYASKEIYDFFM